MHNAVLLDTSFLITLADPDREKHADAKRFYQHFLDEGMPMILSTIVIAEFCVRQPFETLPLDQFIIYPFNQDDAVEAARLDFKSVERGPSSRDALRDDFKIIGHAAAQGLGYLITGDKDTMAVYCARLSARKEINFRCLNLNEGFSLRLFAGDDQGDFRDTWDEGGSPPTNGQDT